MALALVFVIILVIWSLYLMGKAVEHQEFSLMLAGCLVAASAAATVGVCFLMSNYIDYIGQLTNTPYQAEDFADVSIWTTQTEDMLLLSTYNPSNYTLQSITEH